MPISHSRGVMRLLSCVLLLSVACLRPAAADAQARPALDKLADRIAPRIAKIHPQRILSLSMSGCVLDPPACAEFDGALRAAVRRKTPEVQFIEPAAFIGTLKQHHLLTVDAYFPDVVAARASDAGANLVIMQDVLWQGRHYASRIILFDAVSRKVLGKFSAEVMDAQRGPTGQPILIKDSDTAATFVLWNRDQRHAGPFKLPLCDVCPVPPIPVGALAKHIEETMVLVATIDQQGVPTDISIIKSLDPALDKQTLSTVHDWTFHPAIGMDGMPFIVRIPIEIPFDLK